MWKCKSNKPFPPRLALGHDVLSQQKQWQRRGVLLGLTECSLSKTLPREMQLLVTFGGLTVAGPMPA